MQTPSAIIEVCVSECEAAEHLFLAGNASDTAGAAVWHKVCNINLRQCSRKSKVTFF